MHRRFLADAGSTPPIARRLSTVFALVAGFACVPLFAWTPGAPISVNRTTLADTTQGEAIPYLAEMRAASREGRPPAFAEVPSRAAIAQLRTAGGSGVTPRLSPAALHYDACCFASAIATADLTSQGHTDLLIGNAMSADVSVLLDDGAGGYAEPFQVPIPATPSIYYVAIAAGDVDGDGRPDLVATGLSNEVYVFHGNGDGTFAEPDSFGVGDGDWPHAIAIADFNGDGKADIATANNTTGDVSILLGDGTGSFPAATNFAVGANPVAMGVADVTGDGKLDIVTANAGSLDVTVIAGDGAGGFARAASYSIGPNAVPFGIAVGDVNGDGKTDVVVANAGTDGSEFPPPELPGSVSVFVADGAGAFAAAEQYSAGPDEGRAEGIALGDITGDGDIDIVVSRPNANGVAVLAGDGSGVFGDASLYPVSVGPGPIALADATRDGKPDVIAANAVSANVSILPGDGAGDVGYANRHAAGGYPHSVVAIDLNEDGIPDIATANLMGSDVSVLIADGNDGYATAVHYQTGDSPTWIVAGDVDGDGHTDLVTADLGGGTVSILRGDGSGAFAAATSYGVGGTFESPYAVALGDANNDGKLDIATANTNISNESISYLAGNGDGTFATAVLLPIGDANYYSPQSVLLTDVTGDGNADIVTANLGADNVSVLFGNGNGTFAAATHFATDPGPVDVVAGDVTGDDIVDLVTVNQSGQDVSVLVGTGGGAFAAAASYPIYFDVANDLYKPWAWGLALGDINGDGWLDIVTANTQNDTVTVLANSGGTFGSFAIFGTGALPGAVAIADMDGDGHLDVVTSNRENDDVSVLRNLEITDSIFADGFDIIPI
jgi:VCBS repeat protein